MLLYSAFVSMTHHVTRGLSRLDRRPGWGSVANEKRTGMLTFVASMGVRAYNALPPVGSRSKDSEDESILKCWRLIFA